MMRLRLKRLAWLMRLKQVILGSFEELMSTSFGFGKFFLVDGAHVESFVLYYANIHIVHWDGA